MTLTRFKQLLIERMKTERVLNSKLGHFLQECVANKLVSLILLYMVAGGNNTRLASIIYLFMFHNEQVENPVI